MNLMNQIKHIIFCIIDDVRSEHFYDLIERGLLPNLKKLIKTGLHSKNCITDFPSLTYPTQVSMMTGTYTGNYLEELCHGVPSFHWMDRNEVPPFLRSYNSIGSDERIQIYKLNDDLGENCRTLFEMVGEGNTVSISQFISRGVSYLFPERKTKLILYYLLIKHSHNVNKYIMKANLVAVKKLLKTFEKPKKFFDTKEAPIASNLLFVSSDVMMHLYGFNSELYKLNLFHIDKALGILLEGLDKLGYSDETAIAISSDHGNYKAKTLGDFGSFFSENSLKHYHPRKNIKGNMNIGGFSSVGFFNFKSNSNIKGGNWNHPTIAEMENYGPKHINLIEKLFNLEGTLLMYYCDDGNTSKKGKIYLKRKNQKTGKIIKSSIEYLGNGKEFKTKYSSEAVDGDVFNYISDEIANKLLDNKFHTLNEWLDATFHIDFPLYPDLLSRNFKNPRRADIIVSTCGQVSYNIKHGKKENKNLYLHDIGLRRSAIVPLIVGGSEDIPVKEISHCKITDIVPTLLKMLGKKPHPSVVGESLI
ncbi:MAG: alkaline phosphatase family protein [Candidatus Lokiarchaeota archaeon]|nr:alkaline phosphatase family protein [Candidatus Lokiarchaeota archaeon]